MYLDGYIASARGEFDRAIVILTQANKNLPNNPEILRNLGWAYVMRAEVPRGISLLRRAYTISPDEPMIINDLSIALIAAGEDAEARSILAQLGNRDIIDTLKIDTL